MTTTRRRSPRPRSPVMANFNAHVDAIYRYAEFVPSETNADELREIHDTIQRCESAYKTLACVEAAKRCRRPPRWLVRLSRHLIRARSDG